MDLALSAADKLPIATIISKTAHGGTLTEASPNVRVGGVMTGVTLGNPDAAAKVCEELARSRGSKTATAPKYTQSFSNRGIEASRLIIRGATGSKITEGQLFSQATTSGKSDLVDGKDGRYDLGAPGGTYASAQRDLLAQNGVPAITSDLSTAQTSSSSTRGSSTPSPSSRCYPVTTSPTRRSSRGWRRSWPPSR